ASVRSSWTVFMVVVARRLDVATIRRLRRGLPLSRIAAAWYKRDMRPHVDGRGVLLPLGVAILAPAALTGLLIALNPGNTRDYVFVYLGIVAILGLATGLRV